MYRYNSSINSSNGCAISTLPYYYVTGRTIHTAVNTAVDTAAVLVAKQMWRWAGLLPYERIYDTAVAAATAAAGGHSKNAKT